MEPILRRETFMVSDKLGTMTWYIVKTPDQSCSVTDDQILADATSEKWGPYSTRDEAIAKRIGLIRAGKCQPV
jgi:hypothetical protein